MIKNENIENYSKKSIYTIDQNETLGYLITEMNRLRFRRFPVTDEEGIVGIVTSSDILTTMYKEGTEEFLNYLVGEVMTTDIIVANHNDSVKDTITTMYNTGISGVPVVKDDQMIGMFTEKDIILFDDLWQNVSDDTVTAESGIGRPVTDDYVITEDFTFWQAADQLSKNATRQILVKDPQIDQYTGILTAMELASAVVDHIITGDTKMSLLQTTNVRSIPKKKLFQRSTPSVVSSLRLWLNSRGIEAFALFKRGKPVKLITEKDLVGYLATQLS